MMKRYIVLFFSFLSVVAMSAQSDRQYVRSGNKQFKQQSYTKAEAEYRKSLSVNSQNPQAMYNLGCALMMQQKDSAAVEAFQKAGSVETSKLRKAKSYHNIGVICQNRSMYSEAIEAYKDSLRNNPTDDETRYNLALCKRLQKKQKQNQPQKHNNKDDNKNDKNKQKQEKQKSNKDNQQKQQPKQMSRDNAEQLLNAAMQAEKDTKQRMQNTMRQPQSRKLQKNW